MYQNIDLLPELLEEANKFVIENDRSLYRPYFEAIENYCNDNEILIGGKVGVDLLIGAIPGRDSWAWDLYADYAFDKVKALCDIVAAVRNPHIPNAYAVANTRIRNKEFTLDVNCRRIAVMYNLDRYRGFPLKKLMSPPIREGFALGRELNVVGPEMQLIGIYRKLYSPLFVEQWVDLQKIEEELYKLAIEGLAKKMGKIGGSAKCDYAEILDFIELPAIKIDSRGQRASIITTEDPEVILKKAKKRWPTARLVKYDLNILDDFQLTKHAIQGPAGQILDIYNEISYELVPYNTPSATVSLPVAHEWVRLRHLFIDLWTLKIIINTIPNARRAAEEAVQAIVASITRIKAGPILRPDSGRYLGVYVSENVAKKKLVLEKGERFKPYHGKIKSSNS